MKGDCAVFALVVMRAERDFAVYTDSEWRACARVAAHRMSNGVPFTDTELDEIAAGALAANRALNEFLEGIL
jgi:hypothetical protein